MLDIELDKADVDGSSQDSSSTVTTRSLRPRKKWHACRFCGSNLEVLVVDLGMQPFCERYITEETLNAMEPFYPLKAFVCGDCFLVQVPDCVSWEEIYGYRACYSSFSDSWLRHTEDYVNMVVDRFGLDTGSKVVELASKDGHLLHHMKDKGIPVLGIEPAANAAELAIENGIPTVTRFFGVDAAKDLVAEGIHADLLIANNVLAEVPDLNDFVAGIKLLLNKGGAVTIEVPYLDSMFRFNQFDTISLEHYSYFSFVSINRILANHGLTIFDVEEILPHGGSLRIHGRHLEDPSKPVSEAVWLMHQREIEAGYENLSTYRKFGEQVKETKRKLLSFLIQAKRDEAKIVAYGAPGKGNTLLNYCGFRQDFIDYTVEPNPFMHGKYLPGTRIPIETPARIAETKPDYIVIFPWNLKHELLEQLQYVRKWGAKFIVPIPEIEIL